MIYRISQLIFEFLTRILFKVHVSGKNNIPEAPYIIASNHASYLDPPLIGLAFRKHQINFMAKKELFKHPVFRIWASKVGAISVNRGRAGIQSLKETLKRIKDKKIICFFPEGTRSADGELKEAKAGVGFVVSKARVPVVPVYLKGSGEAMPIGESLRLGTKVDIFIGRAILPEEFFYGTGEKKDYETISNLIMDRIADIKERAEKG